MDEWAAEETLDPNDTTVHGQHCLRVAINIHRTRRADLDLLVRETVRLGGEIMNTAKAPS